MPDTGYIPFFHRPISVEAVDHPWQKETIIDGKLSFHIVVYPLLSRLVDVLSILFSFLFLVL